MIIYYNLSEAFPVLKLVVYSRGIDYKESKLDWFAHGYYNMWFLISLCAHME